MVHNLTAGYDLEMKNRLTKGDNLEKINRIAKGDNLECAYHTINDLAATDNLRHGRPQHITNRLALVEIFQEYEGDNTQTGNTLELLLQNSSIIKTCLKYKE